MATITVLVDEAGTILGTAQIGPSSGAGGPAQIGLTAAPGQCIVEVDVDDPSALDAEALHAALQDRGLTRS
jgi:hypothetical protein